MGVLAIDSTNVIVDSVADFYRLTGARTKSAEFERPRVSFSRTEILDEKDRTMHPQQDRLRTRWKLSPQTRAGAPGKSTSTSVAIAK
jgi:hypothetical protein